MLVVRPLSWGRINYLPAGPTPIVFALLAQYHSAIPYIYKIPPLERCTGDLVETRIWHDAHFEIYFVPPFRFNWHSYKFPARCWRLRWAGSWALHIGETYYLEQGNGECRFGYTVALNRRIDMIISGNAWKVTLVERQV